MKFTKSVWIPACVIWFVLVPLAFVSSQGAPTLPIKPPIKTTVDPTPTPPAPADMWTRYFMALLGALTAAVPIFIQAWKNGMATKEAKERVALLHGALAEKLGLPDTTPSVPVPPPKSLDKLDMILSRLEALEKRGQS